MKLKDRRVLVVGLGRSGVAASRLLVRNNARVTATDRSPWDALSAEARELAALGIKMEAGGHSTGTFLSADLIILSPGVPKNIDPLVRAKENGVKIISEIELAYQLLDAPLIALTGSNGKSTTTTLIGEILKAKGDRVFVGGNLGTPLTEYVLSGGGADCVVAELSSFQLETIGDFKPSVSILLNISPDHMDRYPGIQEYAEAKFRIFENQTADDFAVINGDEPWSTEVSARFRGRVIVFSRRRKVENGVFAEEGRLVSNMNGRQETLCEISEIGIKGVHNLENSMAAAAAALLRGCTPEIIAGTLRVFPGLEHRLEFVREIDGVKYINDSKGTNVGAVIKSIEGFNEPILLIAGGRDKGSDFSLLRPLIQEKVKRLILIGEAREKLRRAAGDLTTTIHAGSMEEAVYIAHKEAVKGDVVLLSPACASFDMFKNFEDRGRVFKERVWKLPPVQ
ncbi:MAG: UDP-N-acetylmuramoyl-L-alanine--D-glutamate ligase [Nitrospirae bacterium]|nr:UDP-N-acetylmuramoyl-L-alanine--D-glutamate ligase [Nitrospirota bacterium]